MPGSTSWKGLLILTGGRFDIVVKTHKTMSRKYRALSALLGEEAMNVKDPANTAPEVQSWVNTSLAEIFSSLGSLSNEDACATAKLAALDATGPLLENWWVFYHRLSPFSEY